MFKRRDAKAAGRFPGLEEKVETILLEKERGDAKPEAAVVVRFPGLEEKRKLLELRRAG